MTFEEFLISKGFTAEQAKSVVDNMPANKFYLANEENLGLRYDKLKNQKEQVDADLKAANELVEGLQNSNKDVEGLQTQINEYKEKVTGLETERATERKGYAIKEALTKAGVVDIDYMAYKLGDVEVLKDGSLKDIESKVKALQESNPTFFAAAAEPNDDKSKGQGYKPLDNKLEKGETGVTYSMADLEGLTQEQINENWAAVSQTLENGGK